MRPEFTHRQSSINKNRFGHLQTTEWKENGMEKTIIFNPKPFREDYERQTRVLKEQQAQININKERIASNKIYTCDNRGNFDPETPGAFFPVSVGTLSPSSTSFTFTDGQCFQSATFSYSHTGDLNDIGDVILTIDTEKPESLFCNDWFLFGTTHVQDVEHFYLTGKHQITFKNLSPDAKEEIKVNGVRIYMFCDGYVDTFVSAYNFALQFLGGFGTDPDVPIFGSHVPEYMIQANLNFLNHSMSLALEERPI